MIDISHFVLIQRPNIDISIRLLSVVFLYRRRFAKCRVVQRARSNSLTDLPRLMRLNQPPGEGLKQCLIEKQSYKICNLMPLVSGRKLEAFTESRTRRFLGTGEVTRLMAAVISGPCNEAEDIYIGVKTSPIVTLMKKIKSFEICIKENSWKNFEKKSLIILRPVFQFILDKYLAVVSSFFW